MRRENTLTDEEMKRLGIQHRSIEELPSIERGWTKAQFKAAFAERSMTYIAFERLVHLSPGSIQQSLNKRFPKSDRLIAAFLDVPLHELWPNRYTVTGSVWPRNVTPETLTDEELAELNAKYAGTSKYEGRQITVPFPAEAKLPPGVIGD